MLGEVNRKGSPHSIEMAINTMLAMCALPPQECTIVEIHKVWQLFDELLQLCCEDAHPDTTGFELKRCIALKLGLHHSDNTARFRLGFNDSTVNQFLFSRLAAAEAGVKPWIALIAIG